MVVNSRAALLRSRSPLLKKKLALRSPWSAKDCATVRDMVDFPVPVMGNRQNSESDASILRHLSIHLDPDIARGLEEN